MWNDIKYKTNGMTFTQFSIKKKIQYNFSTRNFEILFILKFRSL